MNPKFKISLVFSSGLTLLLVIIKLFTFNKFSEFFLPLFLGLLWFVLIYTLLTILEKNFPNEFKQFFNLSHEFNHNKNESEINKSKNFIDAGADLMKDKVDFTKSFKSNEPTKRNNLNDINQEINKMAAKEEPNKNNWDSNLSKKPNELGSEDFNFEEKKIAKAVQSMLNKE